MFTSAKSWPIVCTSLCFLLLPLASPSAAGIVQSSSCTRQAVQAAVDQAKPGDTVRLPPCRESAWAGTVTMTKPLTLEGSGTSQTVLHRAAIPANYPNQNPMVLVQDVTGFTMRHLTLDGTQDTHPNQWRDIGIRLVNAVDFRVHAIAFTHLAAGVHVEGNPQDMRGLIDHNTFTDISWQHTRRALGYGVSVNGNGTWPPLALGTAQNVFIEDNTFTRNRHAVASTNGARYVFRHNTIVDQREDAAAIDAHGFTGSWRAGTRQYEIYGNTIHNSATRYTGVGIRGGDGVIFENRMSAMSGDRDILLLNDSGCGGQRKDQIEALYAWGNRRLDGSAAQVTTDCPASIREGQEYHLTARPGYTPYPYPHPLSSGARAVRPSAAPRNLRILSQ